MASAYSCSICHSDFSSNNKLHTHIRDHSEDDSVQAEVYVANPTNLTLIESTAKPTHTPGYAFRSWQYAAAQTSLTSLGKTETICLDTGCTMTLIDKEFLLRQDPNIDIHKRQTETTVRGFGSSRYQVSEYVTVPLYFIAKKNDITVMLKIPVEAHVVSPLRTNMLVGTDSLGTHGIAIDISNKIATVSSCENAYIPLQVKIKPHHTLPRPVYTINTRSYHPAPKLNSLFM